MRLPLRGANCSWCVFFIYFFFHLNIFRDSFLFFSLFESDWRGRFKTEVFRPPFIRLFCRFFTAFGSSSPRFFLLFSAFAHRSSFRNFNGGWSFFFVRYPFGFIVLSRTLISRWGIDRCLSYDKCAHVPLRPFLIPLINYLGAIVQNEQPWKLKYHNIFLWIFSIYE